MGSGNVCWIQSKVDVKKSSDKLVWFNNSCHPIKQAMRGSLPSTRIFTGYTQKIDATLIIIIYKPPSSRMTMASLPVFPPPSIYAGDFNCQHTSWGYQNNSGSGNCLVQWANLNDLSLLYNPKESCSFHSGRWNTETNPDTAFASCTKGHSLTDVCSESSQSPNTDHRWF